MRNKFSQEFRIQAVEKALNRNSWEETLGKSKQKKVNILTSDPKDPALQKNSSPPIFI